MEPRRCQTYRRWIRDKTLSQGVEAFWQPYPGFKLGSIVAGSLEKREASREL